MAFDAKFLEATLSGESEPAAKIQTILSEYEADVKGLKLNRDQLKGEKESALTKAAELEKKAQEYDAQVRDLSEKVKKAGSEETKAYYEAQLKTLTDKHATDLQKLTQERDEASNRYSGLLGLSEFEKAISGDDKNSALPIRPELRSALRDLLYTRTKFERKVIDGKEMYLSGENKGVRDHLAAYLQSPEGKYFVAENNSGGGSGGSLHIEGGTKTMKRGDFDKLNPAQQRKAMVEDKIALVD
jgi:hypothetical protein